MKLFFKTLVISALLLWGNNVRAQEVEKLFNGSDLSNWNFVLENDSHPAKDVFTVKNGMIHIKGNPIGYMYTKNKYADFHLSVEWCWPNGVESNSGIFLLIETPDNPFPNGIECQLKAGNAGDLVLLNGSDLTEYKNPEGEKRPKFPIIKTINRSSERAAGEWNKADIYCRNGIFMVYINDVLQNKGTNKVKEGYIGLQSEGKDVLFRNVTLIPLPYRIN